MNEGNWGVILFLVLIVAFVVYIIAAAMRDRKKRLPEAEEAGGVPVLPENAVPETPAQPYCYSCMTRLSGGETVCPACGRPISAGAKPGHLPAGLVLADRYTVGLAVSENRVSITYLAVDNYLETKHRIREYFPKDYAVRGADGTEVEATPGLKENFAAGKKAFIREIRTLCRLKEFSSAADVTDLFFTNGSVYAVLDWTDGIPLTAFAAEKERLSPEYTLALFAPVIRQLAQEQSMGLLRCNLTPDSFSVCSGMLKLEGAGVPDGYVSTFLKPGFAPEELYRKSGVPGAFTDVYSLCAVMYWCMTGVAPDAASDRVYQDQLRTPSAMGVYLAAGPEQGLMKGLAVYGEDRYPNCAALFQGIFAAKAPSVGGPAFYGPIIDPLTEDPPAGNGRFFREPEDNEISGSRQQAVGNRQ